ncbi:hypothetical protein GJAV_G00233980 [Gymnothorax javanicus]|nr:hypothetical protein GJAV_G00233980 [Gymnothorax javanicus]
MSIDFDSVALQTQQEDEEEYDPEDYAREQELHRLLTDLPDDMLEDSRDSSSPELDYSPRGDHNTDHRTAHQWEQRPNWTEQQGLSAAPDNYENGYDQEGYAYEEGPENFAGHGHLHQPVGQDYVNGHGGYGYPGLGTEESAISRDFSPEEEHLQDGYPSQHGHLSEDYQHEPYLPQNGHPGTEFHQPEEFEGDGARENLQRKFLDSTDHQQVAQLQILNKALSRQVEELEQKLEDGKRQVRYVEHQFNIMKDEKEGLAVSLREAGHVMGESREQEAQLQGKIKALEAQVQAQADREHESVKKLRVAEAAVDSMKLQMAELCRSDTLTRAREKHERDLATLTEQHESRVLLLQQNLDSLSHTLEEKTELCQKLLEQVKRVEREKEQDKLERAGIINTLTQRLEDSQTQCAKLLQTGTAQEVTQLRFQLQQAQSLKSMNDRMNKSLQEELADLKEQISLYESGIKLGVVSLDSNGEWEGELSDSCVQLGIKKATRKNGKIHSPLSAVLADGGLPRDELVPELKAELQRFLSSLKGKRKQICQLQEELSEARSHAQELRAQVERAERSAHDCKVRESSLEKHLEASGGGAAAQEELRNLQQEKLHLQEHVQALERQREELRRSEEKLKSDNLQLCTKMREMIQELDQEKREAAERDERMQQQYRDDVVNRVREEMTEEHAAQVEELTAEFQLQIQRLESQLAEGSKEMLAVQECYITVCREKDSVEQDLCAKMEQERKSREEEVCSTAQCPLVELCRTASTQLTCREVQKQFSCRRDQAALASLRPGQEAQVLQGVQKQLDQAKASWQEEHSKASQAALERVEREWSRRLEEAQGRGKAGRGSGGQDRALQTDQAMSLEARLASQRLRLQREAQEARERAVEETTKRLTQELQDTHRQELQLQVENAVSQARSSWLQEMTSLAEFKAHLQAERQVWEKQQELGVAQQVSVALKEAELSWQRTHLRKMEELEVEHHKEVESLRQQLEVGLQEKADSLRQQVEVEHREEAESLHRQLQQQRGEQQALLKAELARARASWGREKQEEMSRLRAQNEQDYRSFLEQQRALQEQAVAQARAEAERRGAERLLQKEAEFQQLLRARQDEWSAQQESRSREERERHREEALSEVRAALAELQSQLSEGPERTKEGTSASWPEGALWDCVVTGCRSLLSKAVAQAKQEWKKSGQGRPSRVSKESQDQRERDACRTPSSQPCSGGCAERIGQLQKQCQDLQRHLQKTCRQLQHTVRENKASTQRMKDAHEAAIRELEQENQKKLEEVRKSSGGSSLSCARRVSEEQQRLQAGLEEMKEQYMRAVGKIRGDMLRYLRESKERAAEMIRQEVLRERRDTARKMRRYYLSCLQELLQDAGASQGAERKIISAASRLAAMTKVLETPLSKRREGKTWAVQGPSMTKTSAAEDDAQKPVLSPSDLSQAGGRVLSSRQDSAGVRVSPSSGVKSETGAPKVNGTCSPDRTTPPGETPCQDSLKPGKWKGLEEDGFKAPPSCSMSRDVGVAGRTGDVTVSSVTLRTSRMDLSDRSLFQSKVCYTAEACSQPSLIKETPVRDAGGHSDWSAVSMGAHLTHLFPNSQTGKSIQLDTSSSTSISDSDQDDFRTIAIPSKPSFGGVSRGSRSKPGPREPTPGSEGERFHRLCSKSLFSELKGGQQDSGFDSPLSLLHK